MMFKTLLMILFILNSCTFVNIRYAGVFREPIKYKNSKYSSYLKTAEIDLDKKINFPYLGGWCGAGIEFFGFLLPIIPYYHKNTCEKNGFFIMGKTEELYFELKYNNKIYEPYYDGLQIKFKILDFNEFKKAKDKTLIIYKDNKKIKELPFDWKLTIQSVVIP